MCFLPPAFCFLPSAFRLPLSAFRLPLSAFCPASAFCLLLLLSAVRPRSPNGLSDFLNLFSIMGLADPESGTRFHHLRQFNFTNDRSVQQ